MAISWAPGFYSEPKIVNRRLRPIACAVAIITIANLRYPYELFATPLTVRLHVTFIAIQVAFAVLISTPTGPISVEDHLSDRLSPRGITAIDACSSVWISLEMDWPPRRKFVRGSATQRRAVASDTNTLLDY